MTTVVAAHARAQKLINELIQRTNDFVRTHLENTREAKQRLRQKSRQDGTLRPELSRTSDMSIKNNNNNIASRRKHIGGDDDNSNDIELDESLDDDSRDADEDADIVTRLTTQPTTIVNCQMRDYQLEGLNWMIRLFQKGVSGILADEMGLGKTLQTISLLAYLREYRNINGPHLILVPLSTLGNWCNEFKRFCPTMNILKFHGDREERDELIHERLLPHKFDVLVTTFEMASKERQMLRKISWKFLIVDEAHRLKNENSVLSRHAREFSSTNRLLVTGTPLQNNLHELWALLNFLLPSIFTSAEDFDAMFSNVEDNAGIQRTSDTSSTTITTNTDDNGVLIDEKELERQKEEFKADVLKKLHAILRPFMLRRMKADVATNLPPKKEMLLYVGMSNLQKKLYKEILVGNLDTVTGNCRVKTRLANVVMQLRKAANHPYLFEGAEDLTLDPLGEHLVFNSGKMIVADKLLTRLKAQGSRVLIFSQMTKVLDILEDYCRIRNYQYCRIDGNTSTEDREEGMSVFNAPNSEKFVFLLSTRAGGLGINLATADTVILFDSDWNPQMDLQAMDRAHRIGQKKQVNVYRFVTEDTIEERIVMRAETKLRLDAMVIQQGTQQNQQKDKALSSDDMVNMIRCGAERIFKATDVTNISDEDIELILQRGEAKTAEFNEKLQKFTGFNLSFSSTTEDNTEDIYKLDDQINELDAETKAIMEREAAELQQQQRTLLSGSGGPGEGGEGTSNSNFFDENVVGKRERKQNVDYDIDRYFREQLGDLTVQPSIKLTKPLRIPRMYDYQLYDIPRIEFLSDKEQKFYAKHASSSFPPKASGLSDEEIEERNDLLAQGFSSWKFTEFKSFTRGCEKYGRTAYTKISREVGTKSEEEVRQYSNSFWKYYHRIKDSTKIIRAIEYGEAKVQSSQITSTFATELFAPYSTSLEASSHVDLRLRQSLRGKGYEPSDDFALLYTSVKESLWDEWSLLRDRIHHSNEDFMFHYFLKSKSINDLGRRVEMVTKGCIKNAEEDRKKLERNTTGSVGGGGDDDVVVKQHGKRGKPPGYKTKLPTIITPVHPSNVLAKRNFNSMNMVISGTGANTTTTTLATIPETPKQASHHSNINNNNLDTLTSTSTSASASTATTTPTASDVSPNDNDNDTSNLPTEPSIKRQKLIE